MMLKLANNPTRQARVSDAADEVERVATGLVATYGGIQPSQLQELAFTLLDAANPHYEDVSFYALLVQGTDLYLSLDDIKTGVTVQEYAGGMMLLLMQLAQEQHFDLYEATYETLMGLVADAQAQRLTGKTEE